MAEEFRNEQSGSARQQVDEEVTTAQVGQAITGMFGDTYEHQSGGGGAGGHYEFTSLAELDTIITELKSIANGIAQDGTQLNRAGGSITPPADDVMSVLQADITVSSILAAVEHNERMLSAAEAEIKKLEAARRAYSQAEDTGTQTFRMRG